MSVLERFSFGIGDRFGQQGKAQLKAFQMLAATGVEVVPVWNKSNREHTLIGTEPVSVLQEAQEAVDALKWTRSWHVDADHIRLETVDGFIECSDYFTIDVAESIGKAPPQDQVTGFVTRHPELAGTLCIPGIASELSPAREDLQRIAGKYLLAVQDAGRVYRYIAEKKPDFIAEVSMDETDAAQTPFELLVILAGLADEGVRVQAVAPKFTGRFHKGVDYVGDLAAFEREFEDDIAVIAFAVKRYGLPQNLKLSVHSGSDKFSLYPIIHRVLMRTGAGLHLKTAGTTWLEELTGLAEAGGAGLVLAREIYASALEHIDELCAPYASVIEIDRRRLPAASAVATWNSTQFVNTLRHVPGHPDFNPNFRQLLHVAFKVAAKQGVTYLTLLRGNEEIVGKNVTENLHERHLRPLFAP
jgi:hypothetical protein